uniref:Uncharacterized protein n=1 Tax=Arundo donax TaxID=35708 RepID=A0A0A9FNK3_ARUDO
MLCRKHQAKKAHEAGQWKNLLNYLEELFPKKFYRR